MGERPRYYWGCKVQRGVGFSIFLLKEWMLYSGAGKVMRRCTDMLTEVKNYGSPPKTVERRHKLQIPRILFRSFSQFLIFFAPTPGNCVSRASFACSKNLIPLIMNSQQALCPVGVSASGGGDGFLWRVARWACHPSQPLSPFPHQASCHWSSLKCGEGVRGWGINHSQW